MQNLGLWQSNCIRLDTIHLWHINCQKDLRFEASTNQRRGTVEFKVVRENNGYCVQCTFPIYLLFSKFFQRFVEPCHWQVTTPLIKFEYLSICLEFSFILLAKFLLFLMAILETKNFSKKTFPCVLKNVNNKHTLFELVSRWSVHQHPPREQLHCERETWLNTMERTSTLSKMLSQSINTKNIQKKSSLSWKPEKAA